MRNKDIFVDANFACEVDHRRSVNDYIFIVGTKVVSWISQLQKIVALSTIEAEYATITKASKGLIWLQRLLTEFGILIVKFNTYDKKFSISFKNKTH